MTTPARIRAAASPSASASGRATALRTSADDRLVVIAEALGEHAYDGVADRAIAAFVDGVGPIGPARELETRVRHAVGMADAAAAMASGAEDRRVGTVSLAALVFATDNALAVNIGNTRTYRWRDGTLSQLNRDHCALSELHEGAVDRAESPGAFTHHYRNLLTQALGGRVAVVPDMLWVSTMPGDRYVLCTASVWASLSSEALESIVGREKSLEYVLTALSTAIPPGADYAVIAADVES